MDVSSRSGLQIELLPNWLQKPDYLYIVNCRLFNIAFSIGNVHWNVIREPLWRQKRSRNSPTTNFIPTPCTCVWCVLLITQNGLQQSKVVNLWNVFILISRLNGVSHDLQSSVFTIITPIRQYYGDLLTSMIITWCYSRTS